MTVRALYNDHVIAESDDTVVVEGNHYFPAGDVNQSYLEDSTSHTTCPWKGEASYYSVIVDGDRAADAAWYYPEPKDAAKGIRDHVAFWRGVKVVEA
jgi:uncharacterized protein (DUF427 family)